MSGCEGLARLGNDEAALAACQRPRCDEGLGGALADPLGGDAVIERLALVLQGFQPLHEGGIAPLGRPRLSGIDRPDDEGRGARARKAQRGGIGGQRQVVEDEDMLAGRHRHRQAAGDARPVGEDGDGVGARGDRISAASAGRVADEAKARTRRLGTGAARRGMAVLRVSGHRMRTPDWGRRGAQPRRRPAENQPKRPVM